MHEYVYEGPVFQFNQMIMERWTGRTMATTEKKAKSNLVYQFKKQYNRLPTAQISLPGKITIIH